MRRPQRPVCADPGARSSGMLGRVRRAAAATGVAFLLVGVSAASAAENLDRLFFTPLERQALDEARERPAPPPKVRVTGEKREVAPSVEVISFDGKVERSDGLTTVWVNGRAVYTGDRTVEGIRIEPSRGSAGETRFELPPSDTNDDAEQATPRFDLKVGEKVAVQNGRKFEAYEGRPDEESESIFSEQEPAGASSDARPETAPGTEPVAGEPPKQN